MELALPCLMLRYDYHATIDASTLQQMDAPALRLAISKSALCWARAGLLLGFLDCLNKRDSSSQTFQVSQASMP